MKKSITLLFLAVLSAFSFVLTTKAQVTVFTQGSTRYRIPSIVKLQNGNLMAFCDNRYNNRGDLGSGVADIVAKISTNDGVTWGTQQTILKGNASATDYTYAYGDAATVVDRESGKILLICSSGRQGMQSPMGSTHVRFARAEGSPDGQTWTQKDISDAIYGLRSDVTQGFVTSGHICQSSRIKVGQYYRLYAAVATFASGVGAYVIYSDDFGETWHCLGGSSANPGAVNGQLESSESKLEELPNGNVLLSCRGGLGSQNGRWYNVFTYTDPTTASGSWGTLSNLAYGSGECSTSDGEVLVVPAKDASGNSTYLLLQSADYPARRGIRIGYKVLGSEADYDSPTDFTKLSDWTFFTVTTNTSCYSTMVLDKKNYVAFLFEENAETNSYDIQFRSLPLQEITQGKYFYDDATVAAPRISPNGGAIHDATMVSITCGTAGATIHYTTDGSDPTTESPVYSAPFEVSTTTTVKAIAVKDGAQSEVTTANFTFVEEQMEENVLPVDGGVYTIHAQFSDSQSPFYIYNNNGTLAVQANPMPSTVKATENYLWVCSRKADGTYYFSTLDGEGYLGLNTNEMAEHVTDYNDLLNITGFEKGPVSSGSYTGTAMTGYAVAYTQGGSTAYVNVNGSSKFDRFRITTDGYGGYTTDFIFNKVPYAATGTDYGTLAAPVHHGVAVTFARSNDSYTARKGEDYDCYATLNLPYAVSLPKGVTAYKVKSLSREGGSEVQLEEYLVGGTGVTLPRETPVLLRTSGAKGDGQPSKVIHLKPTGHQEQVATGFAGTLGRQVLTDYDEETGAQDGIYYILAKKNGHVAFFYLGANSAGEMAIAKNKAYYKLSASGAKPASLSFSFDDTPTAIRGITDRTAGGDRQWYDLTGRRVSQPSHGIYISNGRKIVVK